MATARREDLEMKIPALAHLSRLGYGYLTKARLRARDRETNFLPEVLKEAAERINGVAIDPGRWARLLAEMRAQLEEDDLGRRFYGTLRDGWDGLKLIDYDRPENNAFQSAAELACGSGAGSFRPDITLFINGLPLAMIEVKTRQRPQGLRAEYDRMLERFRSREGRRYLQCAQIWAFSNDRAEDPYRLTPAEGAFFATGMTEDIPLYAVRGTRGKRGGLAPRNEAEERRILADNGLAEMPRGREYRRNLSPGKATHRMLTALFQPERFLFLLRYGIRYIREMNPAGATTLTRRMLTMDQLAVLERLKKKAARGYRNWTAPSRGAAGEQAANASLVALTRDLAPGARVYWVSEDAAALKRDREALKACGIPCALPGDDGAADPGAVILMVAEGAVGYEGRGGDDDRRPRVFILPPPLPRYGEKGGFPARLRRAEPEAILVTRTAERTVENRQRILLTGETMMYYTR